MEIVYVSIVLTSILMETRQRIVKTASELIMRFGAKSVTMNDIANELGMSKKTLYQHFSNKEEIIFSVTEVLTENQHTEMLLIRTQAKDAVHEVMLILNWMSKMFQELSPAMINDIRKYYPKSWRIFQEFKSNVILGMVKENLEWGQGEGIYRPEMNIEIISLLRVSQIETCLDPAFFPLGKFDLAYIQKQTLLHFLHGVATMKGKLLIDQYLGKQNED